MSFVVKVFHDNGNKWLSKDFPNRAEAEACAELLLLVQGETLRCAVVECGIMPEGTGLTGMAYLEEAGSGMFPLEFDEPSYRIVIYDPNRRLPHWLQADLSMPIDPLQLSINQILVDETVRLKEKALQLQSLCTWKSLWVTWQYRMYQWVRRSALDWFEKARRLVQK